MPDLKFCPTYILQTSVTAQKDLQHSPDSNLPRKFSFRRFSTGARASTLPNFMKLQKCFVKIKTARESSKDFSSGGSFYGNLHQLFSAENAPCMPWQDQVKGKGQVSLQIYLYIGTSRPNFLHFSQPRADPINKLSHINLHYAGLEHFDWLFKFY